MTRNGLRRAVAKLDPQGSWLGYSLINKEDTNMSKQRRFITGLGLIGAFFGAMSCAHRQLLLLFPKMFVGLRFYLLISLGWTRVAPPDRRAMFRTCPRERSAICSLNRLVRSLRRKVSTSLNRALRNLQRRIVCPPARRWQRKFYEMQTS